MGQLIASPPLYEKLKDELRDYIGRERPRLLPGENELVTHYGVSRNTVRRALRDLTTEGLLRPVQGLGTLVNYDQPAGEAALYPGSGGQPVRLGGARGVFDADAGAAGLPAQRAAVAGGGVKRR